jgi:putative ABC transport system permease protein
MNVGESFESALQSVKANKLRSFLTMLGIIIGISSVITISSIGDAVKQFITGEFEGMGSNVVNVMMSRDATDIENRDYFTLEDIQFIKDKIPETTDVVSQLYTRGKLKLDNKSTSIDVTAANEGLDKLSNLKIVSGRFLNEHDIEAASNVGVIDASTATKLFKDTDVIGQSVKIKVDDNYINLNVVGVFKSPDDNAASLFGGSSATIIMPITIAGKVMKETNIGSMSVILTDMSKASEISSNIIKMMENRHQNKGKYRAEEGFKGIESINKILTTITTVLAAIAGISLFVGGVGVMNIMLVSVTERTREIGIRKAIGAKTRDIKIQFLMESIILCLIGGIIGTIIGISVGKIAGSLIKVSVGVSFKTIFIAFSFSSAIGIFFGLYPAGKAAKLDPIEALRYE